jgi:hypothetical protein
LLAEKRRNFLRDADTHFLERDSPRCEPSAL